MSKVHFRHPGLKAPCGANYVNIVKMKFLGAKAEYLTVTFDWKKVTCLHCLKHKPSRGSKYAYRKR